MSNRHIRKLYGDKALPLPEGDSDEEYEPLCAQRSSKKYKYEGLALSSDSETEHESTDAVGVENIPSAALFKKKKKNKKKQRKVKQVASSSSKDLLLMDEIDIALEEVEALLGTAPPFVTKESSIVVDPVDELLSVHQKHLNVANELKRMFGPEAIDPENRRRGRQLNLNRLLRKCLIVPMADHTASFKKFGLSMSVQRREGGCTYFTFDHSREYQRVHHAFLQSPMFESDDLVRRIEQAQKTMHVEGILEGADMLFQFYENNTANQLIEQIISYMQYVAHPSFNLTDKDIRLEYKYPENRTFHVAVLKYMHLLSNRACHRTALELAKLLLKLDPQDPLAVLFVVDTLALRAREHQWLVDAVDYWAVERDAGHLFNVQYSYAMAHFHLASKAKEDLTHADNLLQKAMTNFPAVVLMILQCASATPGPRIRDHPVFAAIPTRQLSVSLKQLMFMYAKLTGPKWREPPVLEWLLRNANNFVDKFDSDPLLQEAMRRQVSNQGELFRGMPNEMFRYLTIIKPMSKLLVDGAVPRVQRLHANERSCDPAPPLHHVDRYGYHMLGTAPAPTAATVAIFELFASLLPNYALPEDLHELAEIDVQRDDMADIGMPQQEAGRGAEPAPLNDADIPTDDELASEGDDDIPTDDEPTAAAVQHDLVASASALTTAVRHFMDVYEAVNNPLANIQPQQQPAERQADARENRSNEETHDDDGTQDIRHNEI